MYLFDFYEIVILDSTFFYGAFPVELEEGLKKHKVYVSECFNTELEQNLELLTLTRQNIYKTNIDLIKDAVKPATLNFKSIDSAKYYHNDIWGLIQVMTSVSEKCIVLTGNKILEQKIILNNKKIDIYDLSDFRFIFVSNFDELRKKIELDTAGENEKIDIPENFGNIQRFYCENGNEVKIGERINSGLEANIYWVHGEEGKIAKVFKKNKLSVRKLNNIKNILGKNMQLQVDWAMFPETLIYYDAKCRCPAGFIESYIKTTKSLDSDPLYLGDINLSKSHLTKTVSESVQLCINIVRQAKFLNEYGFIVSDFTLGNFSFKNNTKNIQMWDADSFGYGQYFSGYCDGNKLSKDYDITTKKGAIDFCEESLYIFVFEILTLGDTPISEYKGNYKLDNPNYAFLYRERLIPLNLKTLFSDVFNQRKQPSIDILLYELQKVLESTFSQRTYEELLSDVLKEAKITENTQYYQVKEPKKEKDSVPNQNVGSSVPLQNMPKSKKSYGGAVITILAILILILVAYFCFTFTEPNSLKNYLFSYIDDSEFQEELAFLDQKSIDYELYPIPGEMERYGEIIDQMPIGREYDQIEDTVEFYYIDCPIFSGLELEEAADDIEEAGWTVETHRGCADYYGIWKGETVCNYKADGLNETVQLEVVPEPFFDDTYLDPSVEIQVEGQDKVIKAGQKMIIDFSTTGPPSVLENAEFKFSMYPDVDAYLEEWDGSVAILWLDPQTPCQGYLQVALVESGTDHVLSYLNVYLTVTQ